MLIVQICGKWVTVHKAGTMYTWIQTTIHCLLRELSGPWCHRFIIYIQFGLDSTFLNFFRTNFIMFLSLPFTWLITPPHVHMTYVYSFFSWFPSYMITWPWEIIIVLWYFWLQSFTCAIYNSTLSSLSLSSTQSSSISWSLNTGPIWIKVWDALQAYKGTCSMV